MAGDRRSADDERGVERDRDGRAQEPSEIMSRRELVVGDSASLVAFTISYTRVRGENDRREGRDRNERDAPFGEVPQPLDGGAEAEEHERAANGALAPAALSVAMACAIVVRALIFHPEPLHGGIIARGQRVRAQGADAKHIANPPKLAALLAKIVVRHRALRSREPPEKLHA